MSLENNNFKVNTTTNTNSVSRKKKSEYDLDIYMKSFVCKFAYFRNKGIIEEDRKKITPAIKTKNTFFALSFLLTAGFIPWYGFIDNQSKKQGFDLIQSNQSSFLSIPRNSLVVAPLLAQFISRLFNITLYSRKQNDLFTLGIRNLSILLNCFVSAPFLMYYYHLPQQRTIFLFKKHQSLFIWVIYPLQALVMSYIIIYVEYFLDNYGYGENNIIFYYQLSELFVTVSRRTYAASPYTAVLLFFIVFISNKIYSKGTLKIDVEPINHNMFVKPIILERYDLISTSLMVYATLKKAALNFFTLIWDPVLTYLKYEKYCLPDSVRDSLFFTGHYQILLSYPDWKVHNFLYALLQYIIDCLLWAIVTYNIYYFVLAYSTDYILYNLEKSKLKIKNVPESLTQEAYLRKIVSKFRLSSIIQSLPLMIFIDLSIVWSMVLKGADFLYFYCRLKQLVQTLKNTSDIDLPFPFRKFKTLLK